MSTKRPDPEELLKRIQDEEHKKKLGKLKIYLGAAPGVGKTYAMLSDAFEKRLQGVYVVIGIAESHGRKEIESMIRSYESIPKQVVDYHGKQLLEFDIDEALRRKPELLIVDEMAHTNAPGLRHTKRWQDIKELLDRGINIYTTLNVQHIESLNDNVAQILNTSIKETVPDSMIELAYAVELVDIPYEKLIKRLHDGKVYIADQAQLAIDNFFREGNLIALRELALRITAERVEEDVLSYRQGHGITQIWPTKAKILVCVGPRLESRKLIRAARRLATSLQADWIAVHVDTPKLKYSEEKKSKILHNLRLAEQLGAETRILSGFDIVKEIMSFAHTQNITLVMIWKSVQFRWHDLFSRSLADEMVRNSGEIDVYIMTGTLNEDKEEKITPQKSKTPWRFYGISTGIITIATMIDSLLYPYLAESNLIMVYLLAVTMIALFGKIGPSILASVLSVLAYDFFFLSPFYGFALSNIQYIFTLIVMLILTQVISYLTILTQYQANSARIAAERSLSLYKLSKQLASTRGVAKLLDTGVQYISQMLNVNVVAFLQENGRLLLQTRDKISDSLDPKDLGIAQLAFDLGQPAGLGTDILTLALALYLPILGTHGTIGVLRIQPTQGERLFTPEQMRLLETCIRQIALAIEVDRTQVHAS